MSVNGDRDSLVGGQVRLMPDWYRGSPPPSPPSHRRSASVERAGGEGGDVLDRVREWALRALLALGVVSMLVLALAMVLILAWRWVAYGLRRVRDNVFGHFSDMYRWLDQYSPSETEEERREKLSTLRERVVSMLNVPGISWIPMWNQLDYLDWVILVAVVVLVGAGLYGSLKLLARAGRRAVLTLRGVQLEAMQPGSVFTPAKIPECQVQVLIPGLLFDVHQGYGTRIGEYLVTNAHVIAGFPELVLRGPSGKKLMISPSFVRSRGSEDLVYVHLGLAIFAQLGAKSARASKATFQSGFATCVGPSGASTGRVSKSTIRGKLIYEGSTVPGMSGAPYLMQGIFVGLHQGASGNNNLGISYEVIRAEMPYLVQKEAIFGPSPGDKKKDNVEDIVEEYSTKFQGKTWNLADLDEMFADRYGSDDWAGDYTEDEEFWNRKLEFEAKVKARAPKVVPTSITVSNSDGSLKQIPLSLHNGEGQDVVLDLASASDMDYLASLRVGKIVERVEVLEKQLAALQQRVAASKQEDAKLPPPSPPKEETPQGIGPVRRYPCDQCETVCRTEERLLRHNAASHPIKPESALAEDTGKSGQLIQQRGSFLGRSRSQPPKKKSSKSTSASRVVSSGSRSLEESLSLMLASQRSTEILLKKFLEVSAGRASGITQS